MLSIQGSYFLSYLVNPRISPRNSPRIIPRIIPRNIPRTSYRKIFSLEISIEYQIEERHGYHDVFKSFISDQYLCLGRWLLKLLLISNLGLHMRFSEFWDWHPWQVSVTTTTNYRQTRAGPLFHISISRCCSGINNHILISFITIQKKIINVSSEFDTTCQVFHCKTTIIIEMRTRAIRYILLFLLIFIYLDLTFRISSVFIIRETAIQHENMNIS